MFRGTHKRCQDAAVETPKLLMEIKLPVYLTPPAPVLDWMFLTLSPAGIHAFRVMQLLTVRPAFGANCCLNVHRSTCCTPLPY